MSKRRKWVIVLTCTVAAIALAVLLARDREPRYQGKPLGEWCQIHAQTAPSGSRESREAIQQMGASSLPFLTKWIMYNPARFRLPRLVEIGLFKLGLWKPGRDFQIDPRHEQANAAARAFGALREQAAPVIPQLLASLRATTATAPASRIALSLALIGTNAIPAIAAYLNDTNAPNREFIIYIFAYYPEFTTNAAPVIPGLARCRVNADQATQMAARFALDRIAAAGGATNTAGASEGGHSMNHEALTNAPPQ